MGTFFPSRRPLYLSSFSDTHTHTHTHTSCRGEWALFSLMPSALSFFFLWHTHTHTHTHTCAPASTCTHVRTQANKRHQSFNLCGKCRLHWPRSPQLAAFGTHLVCTIDQASWTGQPYPRQETRLRIALDRITTRYEPWSPAVQRHLTDYVTGECLSPTGPQLVVSISWPPFAHTKRPVRVEICTQCIVRKAQADRLMVEAQLSAKSLSAWKITWTLFNSSSGTQSSLTLTPLLKRVDVARAKHQEFSSVPA